MKNKTKNIGRIRRFIFRMLGTSVSKTVVHRILRSSIDRTPAAFPADLSRRSDILFILPTDKIEMVYQLETLFSIIGKYKDSTFTFVCPAAHSSFVSGLKNARIIGFTPEKFLLYSEEHNRVVKEVASRSFDICVMLERQYTLAHLYVIGVSRAHLRIGWDEWNCSPFLNVRLIASPSIKSNLWERNLEAAKILNAEIDTKMRWGVQKSTTEEVAKLLSDNKLKKEQALICVNIASLENCCGKEWCVELLKALKTSNIGQVYIFGGADEKNNETKDIPFPMLPPMSVPKTATLMTCTDVVITGFGPLLGLAQISASKIVPVLTREQFAMYCKRTGRILPSILSSPSPTTQQTSSSQVQKPDAEVLRSVIKNVKELVALKSKDQNA